MEYTAVNSFFQNLVSLALENRLVLALLWIVAMYFFLKKLSKKDKKLINIDATNSIKLIHKKIIDIINNKNFFKKKLPYSI